MIKIEWRLILHTTIQHSMVTIADSNVVITLWNIGTLLNIYQPGKSYKQSKSSTFHVTHTCNFHLPFADHQRREYLSLRQGFNFNQELQKKLPEFEMRKAHLHGIFWVVQIPTLIMPSKQRNTSCFVLFSNGTTLFIGTYRSGYKDKLLKYSTRTM